MMADWLIGLVHWEQTPTNSRHELVLAEEETDLCKNISPRAELGWNTLSHIDFWIHGECTSRWAPALGPLCQ